MSRALLAAFDDEIRSLEDEVIEAQKRRDEKQAQAIEARAAEQNAIREIDRASSRLQRLRDLRSHVAEATNFDPAEASERDSGAAKNDAPATEAGTAGQPLASGERRASEPRTPPGPPAPASERVGEPSRSEASGTLDDPPGEGPPRGSSAAGEKNRRAVVKALTERGELAVIELARIARVPSGSIVGVVDRLEADGIVRSRRTREGPHRRRYIALVRPDTRKAINRGEGTISGALLGALDGSPQSAAGLASRLGIEPREAQAELEKLADEGHAYVERGFWKRI